MTFLIILINLSFFSIEIYLIILISWVRETNLGENASVGSAEG